MRSIERPDNVCGLRCNADEMTGAPEDIGESTSSAANSGNAWLSSLCIARMRSSERELTLRMTLGKNLFTVFAPPPRNFATQHSFKVAYYSFFYFSQELQGSSQGPIAPPRVPIRTIGCPQGPPECP